MDFKDSIMQLAERVKSLKESILTEEATKNAFIMPFIQILGYDVFNPLEVVPEMDCDIVKKKGDNAKVAVRNIRRDAMDKFKKMKKGSEISEDDFKDLETQVQKMTDKYIKKIDDSIDAKTKEVMTV